MGTGERNFSDDGSGYDAGYEYFADKEVWL
jgi:hypothetical protein